jgi:molecular chaperone Hsp33
MKKHTDTLQRFLFEQAPIRGEVVHLEHVWKSVIERHDYPDVLRDLMGELTAAAVLLAATLKLDGSLVLQIHGKGVVKLLVVECSGDLEVRATAKWDGVVLPMATLQELVGDGRFVITLDPKDGNKVYQGIVALEGESVADILQNYMTRSEQLDTHLWLAADGQRATGLLLQKMPERKESDSDSWTCALKLSETVKREELLELPSEELLHRLFHEEDLRLFDAQPVVFACSCSKDNVVKMLRMLGKEEVNAVLDEKGLIEVHCEFCNQRYQFDAIDAKSLFSNIPTIEVSETRH